MDISRYRVDGKKLKLSDLPTDETKKLDRGKIEQETADIGAQLTGLQDRLYAESQQSLLVVLQARDAGGKDGTVKHVFEPVNPQGIIVTSFKVPNEEDLKHDFLWRIHPHTPSAGMIAVFNRSHYEDVLVTRVHKLIDDKTAQQRFEHIRHFEELLISRGTRILKLYLHISPEEQRQRLQARLDDPSKNWKFNPGDLKERALWDDYTAAYEDALSATSTDDAPWYVIPADQKWYRNRVISQLLLETLEDMNPQYPKSEFDLTNVAVGKL
ncbi:polyphosphate kinase 2 family protein [Deinococcus psychrotolerans]|uniref:Polyphosphate kinase 2 family protein n=1 Tax=Deinococcus psychrotolerans TaxID=2489213 RepID=A0A3G8YE40_9DEIO|nr:polyphosphate kinase 2 family protein [Deinococcus psychrotolerans]AZI43649.1 polyphosphate kinase 2 family protein [Deinococcus psychrotolerans]